MQLQCTMFSLMAPGTATAGVPVGIKENTDILYVVPKEKEGFASKVDYKRCIKDLVLDG